MRIRLIHVNNGIVGRDEIGKYTIMRTTHKKIPRFKMYAGIVQYKTIVK